MHKNDFKRNFAAIAVALGAAAIAPAARADTLGFVNVAGSVSGSASASKVWTALSGTALSSCKQRYSRTTYVKLWSYETVYQTTSDKRTPVEARFACRR
jgi:uncharacterized protein (DUF697 family)